MSETKKYLSGAEKRKKKDNIINYVSKLPKITTFFEMAGNLNKSTDTSLIQSSDGPSVIITDENNRSDIMKQSSTNTTNINNVHMISNKLNMYKDSYYWPSKIDDSFISYCIEKGPDFFQNDGNSFEKSARKKGT